MLDFECPKCGSGQWTWAGDHRACRGCGRTYLPEPSGEDCDCDLGYTCPECVKLCPLCDRPHEEVPEEPKLCGVCEATSKAHARLIRREREWMLDGGMD